MNLPGFEGILIPRGMRSAAIPVVLAAILVGAAFARPAVAHTTIDVQIEEMSRLIAAAPRDGGLYFRRAEMQRSIRRWQAAAADYDRARLLAPALPGLDLAAGTMWLEAGKPERALRLLERFLQKAPGHPHGHLARARALAQLERWKGAVREFDRALALFTTAQPEFYLERASAQAAQGREGIAAAIQGLDEGMARLGEALSLQLSAFDLEMRSERYDEALARLERIAAGSPRPEIWNARRESVLASARAQRASEPPPASDQNPGGGGRAEAPRVGAVGPHPSVDGESLAMDSLHLAGKDEAKARRENDARRESGRESAAGSGQPRETVEEQAITAHQGGGGAGLEAADARRGPEPDARDLAPQRIFDDRTAPEVTVTRGPYLQSGSQTSIVVRWRTSVNTDSRVRYGNSPASLTQLTDAAASTKEHIVTLQGLSPGTTYYYSVGSTTVVLAGGDLNHFFLTAPPAGRAAPYRFWAIGDSGTADANARAVRDAYAAFTGSTHTNLWLMLGDNAYTTGTDAQFQAAVFDTYPEMLRKSVLWLTYGNHDSYSANAVTQSGPYFDNFSLPTGAEAGGVASGTEAYYSFDYGNVHFICLDSMDSVFRSPSGAQMVWLQQDLAASHKNWTIAFWHHPPYTRGSHNSDNPGGLDPELVEMRQNFLPLLEQAGVDLVLSGHSHSYERSFLIDGHYGSSGTFTNAMKRDGGDGRPTGTGAYEKATLGQAPHEGAVYAVAGSSGQIGGGALNHPAMYISLNRLGALVLDVNGGRLDAKFLDNTGAILDSFTLMKGAPAPRPVPDGRFVPGTPARADKLTADGSVIGLSWDAVSCAPSTQHEVLWGKASDLPNYVLAGAVCNIGNSGSFQWSGAPAVPVGERFLWWTIVGTDGRDQEGSWGYSSSGAEQHPGTGSGLCGMSIKNTAHGCP